MDVFIYSNTKYLDFRRLSITSSESVNTYCENLINDKEVIKLETSPFVLFERRICGKNLLCASFNANELNALSSRFFRVDRSSGQTLTKCLIALLLEEHESVYLTEEVLARIARAVFNLKWFEVKYSEPIKLKIDIQQEIVDSIKPKTFFKKACREKLELFYKFNAGVQYNLKTRNFKNVLYYVKQQEKFNLNVNTKFIKGV